MEMNWADMVGKDLAEAMKTTLNQKNQNEESNTNESNTELEKINESNEVNNELEETNVTNQDNLENKENETSENTITEDSSNDENNNDENNNDETSNETEVQEKKRHRTKKMGDRDWLNKLPEENKLTPGDIIYSYQYKKFCEFTHYGKKEDLFWVKLLKTHTKGEGQYIGKPWTVNRHLIDIVKKDKKLNSHIVEIMKAGELVKVEGFKENDIEYLIDKDYLEKRMEELKPLMEELYGPISEKKTKKKEKESELKLVEKNNDEDSNPTIENEAAQTSDQTEEMKRA